MRMLMVPPSIEEMKAKSLLLLINNDNMEGAYVDTIADDQLTYLILFQSSRDNKAKTKAIENREKAYILSGQANPQPQQE